MGRMPDADPNTPGRQCVTCGRTIDWQANVCQYCGHDFRMPLVQPAPPRSSKPVVGGVLIILAGVLSLAMSVMMVVIDPADLEAWGYDPSASYDMSLSDLEEALGVCGAIGLVLALVAILGGTFAVMRKSFAFAIIGGICAIIGFGFVVGSVLGLVGLILVALSRSEF